MTSRCYSLLADSNWETLVLLTVLAVLAVLGKVFTKAREKYERERAEQREKEYEAEHRARQAPQGQQERRPARRPTPAEQAVAVLRQVLTGEPEQPEPPPPKPVAPPQEARPAPRLAGRRGARLGQGVRGEVGRLERELAAEETGRRERIGRLEALRPSIPEARRAGAVEERRRVVVNLRRPRNALSAIVYSEILGLPKALRGGPEPWER